MHPISRHFRQILLPQKKPLVRYLFSIWQENKISRGISSHQKIWTVGPLWCKKKRGGDFNYSAVPNCYSDGTQKYKNETMRVGNILYQIWVNQLLLLIVEKQKIPILNFLVWPIKGELSVGPWDWTLAVGGNIYVHIHMQ